VTVALTAILGDTAVLGWYEEHRVLAAIAPEGAGEDRVGLLQRQLARTLDTETLASLSIVARPYHPGVAPSGHDVPQDFPLDFGRRRSTGFGHYRIKRVLDIIGSLALLTIASPALLLIALLIRLTSPGPILFRQTRVGQRARPFTMLKFRSMRANADPALHHEFVTKFIKSSAQLHPTPRKALYKLTDDPRVTPVGRILRRTSLDELPQLWNVLRGDMALVGPRPPLPYEVQQYRPWHRRRIMEARPGLTGLWQVAGRSRTTFDDMVRLDLRYVRTCSLWTDIKILFATPRAVISGKGAG
jgi:lipopolysaccharide/colanic/teichoic acid biosynthesis glycosyltransferase